MADERDFEQEEEVTFYIPLNYDETGSTFLGLIDIRRAVQCLIIFIPGALIWSLPLITWVKIVLEVLVCLPLLAIGLLGVQEQGLLDLARSFYSFSKSPKTYSANRITQKKEVQHGWRKTPRRRQKARRQRKK